MEYKEITRKRVGEFEINERMLLKEMKEQGFKLVDKRPCKRFGLKDLYWYYFDKVEYHPTAKDKIKNLKEK